MKPNHREIKKLDQFHMNQKVFSPCFPRLTEVVMKGFIICTHFCHTVTYFLLDGICLTILITLILDM